MLPFIPDAGYGEELYEEGAKDLHLGMAYLNSWSVSDHLTWCTGAEISVIWSCTSPAASLVSSLSSLGFTFAILILIARVYVARVYDQLYVGNSNPRLAFYGEFDRWSQSMETLHCRLH